MSHDSFLVLALPANSAGSWAEAGCTLEMEKDLCEEAPRTGPFWAWHPTPAEKVCPAVWPPENQMDSWEPGGT